MTDRRSTLKEMVNLKTEGSLGNHKELKTIEFKVSDLR